MQRLDLQFYAFFVVLLCGAVLGVLFDVLRAARRYYRMPAQVSAAADLLFWAVATVALSGSLFYANWAELRLYVGVGLFLGVWLYLWLASQVVLGILTSTLWVIEQILDFVSGLLYRIVWVPLSLAVRLIQRLCRLLAAWSLGVIRWFARMLSGLLVLVAAPLVGPYRCARLRYLRLKRLVRRRLRK